MALGNKQSSSTSQCFFTTGPSQNHQAAFSRCRHRHRHRRGSKLHHKPTVLKAKTKTLPWHLFPSQSELPERHVKYPADCAPAFVFLPFLVCIGVYFVNGPGQSSVLPGYAPLTVVLWGERVSIPGQRGRKDEGLLSRSSILWDLLSQIQQLPTNAVSFYRTLLGDRNAGRPLQFCSARLLTFFLSH